MRVTLAVTLFVALAAFTNADHSNNWAILVSGSDGWGNYRHQSDVAHAWQILTKAGIPADQIITLSKDDIADHRSNPFQGEIYNHPDKIHNVYDGHVIDYSGEDTSAEMLYAVMTGDSEFTGGRKVLESTAESNVFFFYSDHGSTNLLAMPVGGYVYADEFQKVLETMKEKNMYNEFVIYIEACYSGSMFDKTLPEDMNIYATTASSPSESSYAHYYDEDVGAYLGDEYSISWMEDSDEADLYTRTVKDQFEAVRERTKMSKVHEYGDLSIAESNTLSNFQASGSASPKAKVFTPLSFGPFPFNNDRVSSRDVPLATLLRNLERKGLSESDRADLLVQIDAEVAHREAADVAFNRIADMITTNDVARDSLFEGSLALDDYDCLRSAVNSVEAVCGRFSDYSLKYASVLNNACAINVSPKAIEIAAQAACPTTL